MRLEIDMPEHHYNNIMAFDSVSLGRVPYKGIIMYAINAIKHGKVLEQAPRCKECKWWKDSDGKYRRGCGAESQCPINRKEVYEGNGYCYMFEPQESEVEGGNDHTVERYAEDNNDERSR